MIDFIFFIVLQDMIRIQYLSLHGSLSSFGLLNLSHLGSGLGSKRTTAPVTSDLLVPLIVVGLDSLNQLGQGGFVIGLNLRGRHFN